MCVYIYSIYIIYIYVYLDIFSIYIYIFIYFDILIYDIFYVIILHYYVSIVLDDSICLKETSHCLSHAFSNQLAGSSWSAIPGAMIIVVAGFYGILLGTNISPFKGTFDDDVPVPEVGLSKKSQLDSRNLTNWYQQLPFLKEVTFSKAHHFGYPAVSFRGCDKQRLATNFLNSGCAGWCHDPLGLLVVIGQKNLPAAWKRHIPVELNLKW